jgi:hypothetical protein
MAIGALCVALIGCATLPSRPPGGGGRSPQNPRAPRAPFVPVTTTLSFDGNTVPPFEDPSSEDERRSGRWSLGRWIAVDGQYEQMKEAPTATLMIRRYNGEALGKPNGYAPSRYRFESTIQAFKAADVPETNLAGSPVGLLAIIPYYLDSTHYVLMEGIKNRYEVWFVDGMTPGDEWNADTSRKFNMDATPDIAVNQPIQLGAEVDTKQGAMKVYINGELKEVLQAPFIKDVQHSVALVSNGNYVAFKDVKLTPLSAD